MVGLKILKGLISVNKSKYNIEEIFKSALIYIGDLSVNSDREMKAELELW